MTAAKEKPDWERIELDYRAGVLSLREIAAKNPGVSHVSIAKRAKKENWPRDLNAKIKAKADALVNKATANSQVNKETRALTEQETVDGTAAAILQVRLSHREDIARGRKLAMALLAELEAQTGEPDTFKRLAELVAIDLSGDGSENEGDAGEKSRAKLLEAYNKVMSLPSRVDTHKKLSESLRHLIGLEANAWGLSVAPEEGPSHQTVHVYLPDNGRG